MENFSFHLKLYVAFVITCCQIWEGGGIALDLKNYSNVSLCKTVIPNVELNVLVYSAWVTDPLSGWS